MPFVALIWSAITSKIAGPLAIGAAVLLLAWGIVERVQLAGARLTAKNSQAAEAMAKADLKTCQANEITLNGAITRQNAAVADLKAQGDQTSAALTKAASAALSARATAERQAAAIRALKPAGPRDCPAVDALFSGAPQ